MRIRLNEIPEDGQKFEFQGPSELQSLLKDLLGNRQIKAEAFIRRTSPQTYELRGWVRTQVPEQCSRCAEDFDWSVDEVFKEILMPAQKLPRDAQSARVNHISDLHLGTEISEVSEFLDDEFDLGAFLKEMILVSVPEYPSPPLDALGNCEVCRICVRDRNFSYDEAMPERKTPFSALKDLKLS